MERSGGEHEAGLDAAGLDAGGLDAAAPPKASAHGRLRRFVANAPWYVLHLASRALISLFLFLRRYLVRGLSPSSRRPGEPISRFREEIESLARLFQAFRLDLEEQDALQRSAELFGDLLEAHPAPVLFMDPGGRVLASNRRAHDAQQAGGAALAGGLEGRARERLTVWPEDLLSAAREEGWGPADAEPERVVAALSDREGGDVLGFVEVWTQDLDPGDEAVSERANGKRRGPRPECGDWLLAATILAQRVRGSTKRCASLPPFDRRAVFARRLFEGLAQLGTATQERAEVEVDDLVRIALADVKRETRRARWHVRLGQPPKVHGSRYQLRKLVTRLLRAAGRQAGEGGELLVFTREQDPGGRVFVGVWASKPGGQSLLDPPGGPALTQDIAGAHGGGVEVDPEFDVHELATSEGVLLPCHPVGSLYLSVLSSAPLAARDDAPSRPVLRLEDFRRDGVKPR